MQIFTPTTKRRCIASYDSVTSFLRYLLTRSRQANEKSSLKVDVKFTLTFRQTDSLKISWRSKKHSVVLLSFMHANRDAMVLCDLLRAVYTFDSWIKRLIQRSDQLLNRVNIPYGVALCWRLVCVHCMPCLTRGVMGRCTPASTKRWNCVGCATASGNEKLW